MRLLQGAAGPLTPVGAALARRGVLCFHPARMDTAADTSAAARVGTLRVENLGLTYASAGSERFTVLDIERMEVEAGAVVGITGPSGSGKTSLLYALTGIEKPDRCAVRWGDVDNHEAQRARPRQVAAAEHRLRVQGFFTSSPA